MNTTHLEVLQRGYSTSDVCAVVVTYNPDEGLFERIRTIVQQCHHVIVVDNGSNNDSKKNLKKTQELINSCSFLYNLSNKGIAAAMNSGVNEGLRLGYQVFCTFDQDSRVLLNYVVEQLNVLNQCDAQRTIVGCNYFDSNRNRPRYSASYFGRQPSREVKTVISSGMMFSAYCRHRTGEFNDAYFIDSVDHEYCLRARRSQCSVHLNCTVLMSHSIGESTSRTGFNRSYLPYSHSPERKYYTARNTLWTIRQYGLSEPVWALKQLGRMIYEFTCLCIFENNKAEKIGHVVRGVRDAWSKDPKHNPI